MILCRAVAVVPMAKPSFIRTEQPYALDLAADRTAVRGGATSRRRDIVFVVNPRGLEVRLFGMLFAFWFRAGETHFEEVEKEESCENESVGGYNNGLLSAAKRSPDEIGYLLGVYDDGLLSAAKRSPNGIGNCHESDEFEYIKLGALLKLILVLVVKLEEFPFQNINMVVLEEEEEEQEAFIGGGPPEDAIKATLKDYEAKCSKSNGSEDVAPMEKAANA
ncbi:hypothetical protein BUALT_Bualt07G0000600 [Buddleja alternifolia]|uniref:Uncharacterized protein n=1 Tax=Buddleja alternifolia TaxID=168488 RepID=A0AAV6XDA6_9LAMI|nr:hypothetical protein BUALT_Bualt07G0000600 [Buddleja alternifolia]